MNKRSFDVAFLAGNTLENDKIPDENCDDQNKKEKCETNVDDVHRRSLEKQLVFDTGSKSAFTKVSTSSNKYHELSLKVASMGKEKEPFPSNYTFIGIDKQSKNEFDTARRKGDKNGTKLEEKDNESDCTISPKGKIQSLDNYRVKNYAIYLLSFIFSFGLTFFNIKIYVSHFVMILRYFISLRL